MIGLLLLSNFTAVETTFTIMLCALFHFYRSTCTAKVARAENGEGKLIDKVSKTADDPASFKSDVRK